MTRNQLHGKKFEDLIKACGLFSGSADGGRSVIAKFDIEAKFDKRQGLPTSIKSTGSDIVGLSDARRFWGLSEAHRMIVGRYRQEDGVKIFAEVHELVIDAQLLEALRGDISFADVEAFHNGLSLSAFPKGQHDEARAWAQTQKEDYATRNCAITLNPKIDSKSQRRLQCSVSLTKLIERCSDQGQHDIYVNSIGDFRLPLELNSSAREFGA
jgi:hypothetical protein